MSQLPSASNSRSSQSTEPPSSLQPDLNPVKLKYIPLPTPVDLTRKDLITMTATQEMRPPCRRCLQDAFAGETVHLIGYDPFPADSITPYRGEGPIFIHAEGCNEFKGDRLPERQLNRLLSVRAYNDKHLLAAAKVVDGKDFEDVVGRMLADPVASYVNVHNAMPGCFAVRVERAV